MVSGTVEAIWTYTGFAFWVALAWVLIGAMAWLGAQFLWAVWKKYGRYRKVVKLMDFLKENKECDEKFTEWLYDNGMYGVVEARNMRKYLRSLTRRGRP